MVAVKRLVHALALLASLHHHGPHAVESHVDVAQLLRAAVCRRELSSN